MVLEEAVQRQGQDLLGTMSTREIVASVTLS